MRTTDLRTSHNNNDVYGAVIMTMVTASADPVHLMNTHWTLGSHQPSDQANRLGLWVW